MIANFNHIVEISNHESKIHIETKNTQDKLN